MKKKKFYKGMKSQDYKGNNRNDNRQGNPGVTGETADNEENINAGAVSEEADSPVDPDAPDIHEVNPEDVEVIDSDPGETQEENEDLAAEVLRLTDELEKEKKEYLFLRAEFDNFRKRTIKEKSELIKNGGENVLKGILPIMDDFERGLKAAETTDNAESLKEGMELIYNKLNTFLKQNGVSEMESTGTPFDADIHEAVSAIPAPSEEQKGKVIDTLQKGYTLNDKVLRHAKVVVGQ